MRVIAGEARGRPLAGPPTARTRPTTDKVKGAMFSMIETLLVARRPGPPGDQPPVEIGEPEVWSGLSVLDLYAGTGALGIEALSRGARWCDFVEHDPRVRDVIGRNLSVTDATARGRTIGGDVAKVMRGGGQVELRAPYGVVFLDPPYSDSNIEAVLDGLASDRFLEACALVALEHSRRVSVANEFPINGDSSDRRRLVEIRRRRHGDTDISIFRWRESGNGE